MSYNEIYIERLHVQGKEKKCSLQKTYEIIWTQLIKTVQRGFGG